MKNKYLKLGIFIILAIFTLTSIYVFFTSESKDKVSDYQNKLKAEQVSQNRIREITPEVKKRINEIRLIQDDQLVPADLIAEYGKSDSIPLKSNIIRILASKKLNDETVKTFFKGMYSSEEELIRKIIVKDLAKVNDENTVELFKYFLSLKLDLSDQEYVEMLTILAKNSEGEEKEDFIFKIKSLVPILKSNHVARTLRALLILSEGREDIVKMINERLQGTRNLEMMVLAMTDLAQYDKTWLDQNRDFLMKHNNPQYRSFFVQNLKTYCPRDFSDILKNALLDTAESVHNTALQELQYYGQVGYDLLIENYDKIPADESRKVSFKNFFSNPERLKNNACQN